ncbi:hypothetical protein BSKO_03138 [Bryopsis sp. KO-2023]|nr:hypothetical protein BSKO_03138 [Bryopsis sp. KO-2023]
MSLGWNALFTGREAWGGFSLLKDSSKYLYVVLLIGLLDSFSHSILSLVYTVLLSGGFGVSDIDAGISFGIWGLGTALFCILLSPLMEVLGVKKSLVVGLSLSGVGRTWLAFSHSELHLWIVVYVILPMGSAFTNTVVLIGLQRYSSFRLRGFAHAVHCALLNVAMLTSGLLFDFVRAMVGKNFFFLSEELGALGPPLKDGSRLCVLLGAIVSALAIPLALLLSEEGAQVDENSIEVCLLECGELEQGHLTKGRGVDSHHGGKEGDSLNKSRCPPALKYLMVCVVTINLKQVFQQLNATFPKYQMRAFGRNSHVGLIYSIYPFTMIFLGPIVQWVTSTCNHYDVIHYGSYITAISPFFLAFFRTEWASVLFVAFLSVGEAVWLPRWYNYSSSIGSNGNNAVYTALAVAPQFLAKLPVGLLSGFVLSGWCPENGGWMREPMQVDRLDECEGKYMWGLIGMLALTPSIGFSIGALWFKIPAVLRKARNFL